MAEFQQKTITITPVSATDVRSLYQQLPVLHWLLPLVTPVTELLAQLTNGYVFTCSGRFDVDYASCQGPIRIEIVPTDEIDTSHLSYVVKADNVIYVPSLRDSRSGRSEPGGSRSPAQSLLDGRYSITGWSYVPEGTSGAKPDYELNMNFRRGELLNSLIYEIDRVNGTVRAFETYVDSFDINRTYNYTYGEDSDDFNITAHDALKLLSPDSYELPVDSNYSYSERVGGGRINTYSVNDASSLEVLTSYTLVGTVNISESVDNDTDDGYITETFIRVPTKDRRSVTYRWLYNVVGSGFTEVETVKEISYIDSNYGDILIKRVFSDVSTTPWAKLDSTQSGHHGSLQQGRYYGFPNLIPYPNQLYLEFLSGAAVKPKEHSSSRVAITYNPTDGSCQQLIILDVTGSAQSYVSDKYYNLVVGPIAQ